VKIVVIKNNSLGQIKWEQLAFLGNPEYGCDLHPIDFAAVATAMGVHGIAIADPADAAQALRSAIDRPGPVLVEATVDANEPPLPPKVSFTQARHMIGALMRGTPDAVSIAKHLARDTIREMV
jgi:pyruvate dehydrogenase (quinone)/pyruvate oxidase